MSKDEIAYRVRLMFYSIFAITFAFLFIIVSSYLKITEEASYKQSEQIKSNILDGLRLREKLLFEEFSTGNYESVERRISNFLNTQKIGNFKIQTLSMQDCSNDNLNSCDVLKKFDAENLVGLEVINVLGNIYFIHPMQGWGEKLGFVITSFPLSEISSAPSLIQKVLIYILPFVLLGVLIYAFYMLTEIRIIKPTIKRIIETEKVKAQQSIVRQFAHDIKSPLVALETVLDIGDDTSCSKMLLNDAISRIKLISNDLLEWDRSFVRVDDVDVRQIFQSVINEKIASNKEKFFDVDLSVDKNISSVVINSIDLYRVISNLLNNSIEAAGSRLRIMVDVSFTDGKMVIAIADNGPGIPPEKIPFILAGDYSSKSAGNGLGVSGAKAWVEKLKGDFIFNSILGKGTTILLKIPVAYA